MSGGIKHYLIPISDKVVAVRYNNTKRHGAPAERGE